MSESSDGDVRVWLVERTYSDDEAQRTADSHDPDDPI